MKRTTLGRLSAAAVLTIGLAVGDDVAAENSATSPPTDDGSAVPEASATGGSCAALEETEDVVVTVSSTNMAFAAVLLAEEVGAFDAEGLNVTFETLSAADALAPLGQGRVDVTVSTLNAGVLNAMSEGINIRWIAPLYEAHPDAGEGLWIQPERWDGTGEFDVSVLEGAIVSTPAGLGGTSTFILAEQLLAAGLSLDDLTYKQMGTADILAALEQDALDMGWLSDPFWQQAEGTDLVYVGGFPDPQNGTAMLAGPRLLDRPEVAEAFLRAIMKTVDQYLGEGYMDDAETKAHLATALDVPEENINSPFPHQFDPELSMDTAGDFATRMQETFIEMGELLTYDEPLAEEQVIDASIGAAAAGCL